MPRGPSRPPWSARFSPGRFSPARLSWLTRLRRAEGGRPRPLRELLLIVALFAAYKLGRLFAAGRVGEAFGNAREVWHLERTLRLPSETGVQDGLMQSDVLVHAANSYYAFVHFPAAVAFLLWMYLRRPGHYRWIRRVLVGLTTAALGLHLLVPLAPPRMLSSTGLIDTAARFGPAVYGAPQSDAIANQYAAMPSLHIGWAAVIAVGLVATSRTRWRWLWLAHPVVTVAVVVATANHYWLDGIVVLALLSVTVLLLRPPASEGTASEGTASDGAGDSGTTGSAPSVSSNSRTG
ncbi:phosphatase PAP2 family protein [Actinomadura decatromicini]|uniref:phosphatase PAP2 family protein n=1 Tax=Actinomadura decatromicini TaxID=2604572 RepID=UPI001FE335B3|nr:phosphatase PAP2 family protein [Actinomadura decatromicini]